MTMKKFFALLLAAVMLLSLTACGGDKTPPADSGGDEGQIDAQDIVEQALEDAEEFESFSVEAVEHFLKAYGISLDTLEPDWDWVLANDYCAYADEPGSGYGHAVIQFQAAEGELTDEQINDFYAKVFAATAAISDDGHNIIGYEFVGEGEDALAEVTLEEALDSWMPGWGFRTGGTLMAVYVSSDYDNDKESELDRLFYYNAVEFDIGVGLQKSFDDTWEEMESYFEENEDEIQQALEDYLG